ncbi:hypothetical protein [Pseudomonas sp. RW3S2]|uniref:hypothetical protein n=1 Tax=Pseudomonas sp. RW3S2 TaxID=485884 RepID=UPI0016442224|nr:hypothetical protein [Pseudomonas sp. RW3S2]MBC3420089.1 hypothetical protein [Pseudomonas sp. RW3S2]
MSGTHTKSQHAFIVKTLHDVEQELIKRVMTSIHDAESAANAKFKAENIRFEHHSPANAEYLMLVIFAFLFDRLHGGDRAAGKLILKMEANRLGVSTDLSQDTIQE